MASESARMMEHTQNPPRWADALLRSLLRPSDRESIPGDLLEEYRAAKLPALGAFRANAWYMKQVFSVLAHLIWPWALAITAWYLTLLAPVPSAAKEPLRNFLGRWNPSMVPAPAISLVDCSIYLTAAVYCARRTRLIKTGVLVGGLISLLAWAVVFGGLAVKQPELAAGAFAHPFIFAILGTYALIALSHGVALGIVGGIVGRRWLPPLLTTFGC